MIVIERKTGALYEYVGTTGSIEPVEVMRIGSQSAVSMPGFATSHWKNLSNGITHIIPITVPVEMKLPDGFELASTLDKVLYGLP